MRALLVSALTSLLLATACGRDKVVDYPDGAGGAGGTGGGGGGSQEPRCGDGRRDPGEACDRADLGGATCVTEGFAGGELYCSASCELAFDFCYPGEICDNGVDDDRDGAIDCDDPDCARRSPCPHCGDGIALDEDCDGADLGGNTCGSLGYDGGELSCRSNCTLDATECFRLERCDNGLDDDGDGAIDCEDDDCTGVAPCPRCGDGERNLDEECDGNDLAGGSCEALGYDTGVLLCRASCTFDRSGCSHFEDCANGLDDDGDGLADCDDPDCANAFECPACGNGIVQAGEDCDGSVQSSCQERGYDAGALACSATCSFELSGCRNFICGDGIVEGVERCDDGNLATGDGCTPQCHIEGDVCEAPGVLTWEPTEGVWQWSANLADFFPDYESACHATDRMADAVATFTAPAAGRYFATVDAAQFDVVLSAWSGACGLGSPQAACTDRAKSGEPETIEFDLQAGGTVFLLLAEAAPAAGGPSGAGPFVLKVGEAVCGDGVLQGLEQCEDGNVLAGDGCNADCRFEGDTCAEAFDLNAYGYVASWAETDFTEPGELPTSVPPWIWKASIAQFQPDLVDCAGFSGAPDGVARFVATTSGSHDIRTSFTFWGAAAWGSESYLCSSAIRGCNYSSGAPDGYVVAGAGFAPFVASGETLFVQIEGAGTSGPLSGPGDFWLRVYPPGVCGDGIATSQEECDDGNTIAGDGCDESCRTEATDAEPNNSFATASPLGAGLVNGRLLQDGIGGPVDLDVYSFAAVAGVPYRIETSNSRTLDGACTGGRPDTVLRLFDAAGVLLAENDDRDASTPCSRIDWTASATGTYFIEVSLSSVSSVYFGPYPFAYLPGNPALPPPIAYRLSARPLP